MSKSTMLTIRLILVAILFSAIVVSPKGHAEEPDESTREVIRSTNNAWKDNWGQLFRMSFRNQPVQELLGRQRAAMHELKIAYDNDGLWDWGDPQTEGPKLLSNMVDQYADSGAEFLVWGCGGPEAWSYTPNVQEQWAANLSPEILRKHPAWGRHAERLKRYLDAGTDPLAVILKQSKTRRLPVLAGFRDVNRYQNNIPNSWFLNHPQFHLSKERNPFGKFEVGVNFALHEVRARKVREWIDVVERYDVDGLSLEITRSLPFFEKDQPNKIEHFNTLLRSLRMELDRIGTKRGRRMKLALLMPEPIVWRGWRPKFPPDFFDFAAMGFDPAAWAREELVDIVMPIIYMTQQDLWEPASLKRWTEFAKGTNMQVYGGVYNFHRAKTDPNSCRRYVEVMRAVRAACDGIFVFNSQPSQVAEVLEIAITPRGPNR